MTAKKTGRPAPAEHHEPNPWADDLNDLAMQLAVGQHILREFRKLDATTELKLKDVEPVAWLTVQCAECVRLLQEADVCGPTPNTMRGQQVPTHITEAIGAYWREHTPPSAFLSAVLSNDLIAACMLATDGELRALHSIAHMVSTGPAESFGSIARVDAWIAIPAGGAR